MEKIKCKYCNKEYSKYGIGTHIWRKHGKGKNFNPNLGYKNKSRIAWNKGLTKETDERVYNTGITYSKRIKEGKIIPAFKGKHHTKETKEKISKKMTNAHKGSRCKWYVYEKRNKEKFTLQGTWEVRFAKVLDIIDENWIKPGNNIKEHSFEWVDDDNVKHYYTPDFWSPKLKKYFEVKGYWWDSDKIKMKKVKENNTINVEMVFKKDLEKYEKLIL